MEDNRTLQQGLDEFNKKNEKYFYQRSYTEEGLLFLKSHDAAHVVFGCNTTLYGEGVVKIWTSFGTTESFWKIVTGYQEVSAVELFSAYSIGHFAKNIFRLLLAIPKTLYRVKKMSKPWPFYEYAGYLDTPISKIREEYNIEVL